MNNFTGLSEKSANEIETLLIQYLKSKVDYEIWVFGSRAKDTYKKYSDIDLWIDSQPALDLKEISDLHALFEDSGLAITVDIITPNTCLPEYKNQILSERKKWISKKQ